MRGPPEDSRHLGLQAVLTDVALAPSPRQLGQRQPQLLDPLGRGLDRRDVGLGEVPVVERFLLRAHRRGRAGVLVPWRVSCTIVSPASSAFVWREIS